MGTIYLIHMLNISCVCVWLWYLIWGLPGSSNGKESAHNVGVLGSIPGLERSPGEGHGNQLQYLPGEFHGHRSLAGYSPWTCKVRHN